MHKYTHKQFHPPALSGYESLKAFMLRFESLQNVKKYVESEAYLHTPFHNRYSNFAVWKVRACVQLHTYIRFALTWVHVYMCMHACMYVYVHVCMYVYIISVYDMLYSTCMYVKVYHQCVCACICILLQCICICIRIRICICIHAYIFMYIYTHLYIVIV